MLFKSHVLTTYWVEAFSFVAYIISRVPTHVLGNHTPFELLYSQVPTYINFQVFGCQVFPYLRPYTKNKLSPRSILCVFIRYSSQYKSYRCLDPNTSRIYITIHVIFDENNFPFTDINSSTY